MVIDGGSPLVVADEGDSEPRVFNTFGELEQAERVSPPPQGLVITGSIFHYVFKRQNFPSVLQT